MIPKEGHAIKSGKELERLVKTECVIRIERYGCEGRVHSHRCRGSFAYAMEYKEWLAGYGQTQYRWYSSLQEAQKDSPLPVCAKCRRHLATA